MDNKDISENIKQQINESENMSEEENAGEETVSESTNNSDIDKLILEKEELNNQLLRSIAEFQNFRKRTAQEKDSLRKLANEQFALELLPVLDNFSRTLLAIESGADVDSIKQGVHMIAKQLETALKNCNVTKIPSVGEEFNPEYHEALATIDSADHTSGTVIEEIESGYLLSEKVIRVARVKVAK